ncbi:MAG: acyl-CoA dehydrogenase family protein [Hyphomicrobiales bacterium]|nr:acyl-CoA dehydrogenase family protein [Hyphomicrobiales bacterium]
MELAFTPDEIAFQNEVRAFLAAHLTPDIKRSHALTPSVFSDPPVGNHWQKLLYAKGWAAPLWPKEYGGAGWTLAQRYIWEVESALAGAPSVTPMGLRMVGPVIMKFGTQAQKDFYLPRILKAEDYWCQGYSEPGSGSDLASLKTRAVRDGDHYVINGSKIWTTHAHYANRMFALVRTSDEGKKQDGISFILIDMDTPGISVRPILTIGGDHEVNQVFFDDVRVPVANRVGAEGQGWSYGKYLLEFERGGAMSSGRLRGALRHVEKIAAHYRDGERPLIEDPAISLRLSQVEIDIDALEMTELRIMSSLQTGQNPGSVSSSLAKLRNSEIKQAITSLAVDVLGEDALVWEPRRPLYELNEPLPLEEDAITALPEYLNGRAYTIFGGTSEVQRDIIAKVVIGL